jgi:hypothetical protein
MSNDVSNYEKCVISLSILQQCVAVLLLGSVPLLVYPLCTCVVLGSPVN